MKVKKRVKNNKIQITALGAAMALIYLLTPACGNKSGGNNSVIAPVACLPGQLCASSSVQGYPLLQSQSISYLDPSHQTSLVLSWAAPNAVTVGTAYQGQVNVGGTLTLAPGICLGAMNGGTFQVTGTGSWVGGYGGYIAQVSGNLTVSGMSTAMSGGTMTIAPALIRNNITGAGGGAYGYEMVGGGPITVSFCGMNYTYYN